MIQKTLFILSICLFVQAKKLTIGLVTLKVDSIHYTYSEFIQPELLSTLAQELEIAFTPQSIDSVLAADNGIYVQNSFFSDRINKVNKREHSHLSDLTDLFKTTNLQLLIDTKLKDEFLVVTTHFNDIANEKIWNKKFVIECSLSECYYWQDKRRKNRVSRCLSETITTSAEMAVDSIVESMSHFLLEREVR